MQKNLYNLSCFVNCVHVRPSASGFKISVLLSVLFPCSKYISPPTTTVKKLWCFCLPCHHHPKSLCVGWPPNLIHWMSEQGSLRLGRDRCTAPAWHKPAWQRYSCGCRASGRIYAMCPVLQHRRSWTKRGRKRNEPNSRAGPWLETDLHLSLKSMIQPGRPSGLHIPWETRRKDRTSSLDSKLCGPGIKWQWRNNVETSIEFKIFYPELFLATVNTTHITSAASQMAKGNM